MDELRERRPTPCRHCGTILILVCTTNSQRQMVCTNCGAAGPWAQTEREAIAAWNHSPKPEALTLERLREMGGEPVWVETQGGSRFYALIYHVEDTGIFFTAVNGKIARLPTPEYGDMTNKYELGWRAYTTKPETEGD